MLERRGVISGYEGSKPRQVLITEADVSRVLDDGGGGVPVSPVATFAATRDELRRRGGPRSWPLRTLSQRAIAALRASRLPGRLMADIGSLLRETRIRNKIDITTVEEATKIRAKYLRALENEEWVVLPGPTYVKTFLRTYAQFLGLDPHLLVDEYSARFEEPEELEVAAFARRAARCRSGRAAWAHRARGIGAALAVLGVHRVPASCWG